MWKLRQREVIHIGSLLAMLLASVGLKLVEGTPVIYVNEGGLYQCSLKLDSHVIRGSIVTVRVELGK